MTPFGIRTRIKKSLGMTRSAEATVYHTLTYILPDGKEQVVKAEDRYNILMASQVLPAPISTGRRAGGPCPDGKCALCRIELVDDTGITPMNEQEKKALADAVAGTPHEGNARKPAKPTTPTTRLACHCRIVGSGAKVKVAALFDYDSVKGEMGED